MFPHVPGHYDTNRATETVDKDLTMENNARPCKQPDDLTNPLPDQKPDDHLNHHHQPVTAEKPPSKQTLLPPAQDPPVHASDLTHQDNLSASRTPAAQSHSTFQVGDEATTQSCVCPDKQEPKGSGLLQLRKAADENTGDQLVQQEQNQAAICVHGSSKAFQVQASEDCSGRQTATRKTEALSIATQNAASNAQADPISPLPPVISTILPLNPDEPKLADACQAASAVDMQSELMEPSMQHPNKAAEEDLPPCGWHGSRRGKRKAAPKPGIVSNTKASKLNHFPSTSEHQLQQVPSAVASKMAQQLVELAATCRAAPDAGKEQQGPNAAQIIKASGTSIQGRRVAFILLEECRMLDARTYLDVISAGLQTGQ